MMLSMVAQHLRIQGQNNPTPDRKKAIEFAVQRVKNDYVTLPGQGRALQLVADPYGGRGREIDHPVTKINGQPVYAGFPIKNRLGEIEDPVSTYRDDMKDFSTKFPGLIEKGSSGDVYLGLPDSVSGLHPIMLPNQMPLQVRPGQEIVIPGKETMTVPGGIGALPGSFEVDKNQKATLPTDPAEMKSWLEKNLPPGVYPVEHGFADPSTGAVAYTLQYGFRVKGDANELRRRIAEGEKRVSEGIAVRQQHRDSVMADETVPVQFGTTPVRNYRGTTDAP